MSGSKFSTSRGNVIYVQDFLREFGPDSLRYYIAAAGPETQDVDFTWDEFVRRTQLRAGQRVGQPGQQVHLEANKNVGGCDPDPAHRRRRRAEDVVAQRVRRGRRAPAARQVPRRDE